MKECGHCRCFKSLDECSPSDRDRHNAWCRACRTARNSSKTVLHHRQEYRHSPRVEEDTRRKWRDYRREYRELPANAARDSVRQLTRNGIRSGIIEKPGVCNRCGEAGNIETHHRSYDKEDSWKDIEFLCVPCHKEANHGISQ